MTPRKPDRFERMVRKEQRHDDWGIAIVPVDDAIRLLRNEHVWMRRMVAKRQRYTLEDGIMFPSDAGAWVMVDWIIEQLAQRRK